MDVVVVESAASSHGGEHLVCLGLGSNVEPAMHLRRAIERLSEDVGIQAMSTVWETAAVGSDGPPYLNAALLIRTSLSKTSLMVRLKKIEDELGRQRTIKMAARLTIDIDILVFDDEIVEADLWSQAYRAVPVAELLPDLACPSTGELLSHAASRLADPRTIKPGPNPLARSPRLGTFRPDASQSRETRTP